MKIKKIFLILTTCLLMLSFAIGANAQYIFDENGVVIGENGTTVAHYYDDNGDIAIIGGADGPTEIFVAEPNYGFLYAALGVAAIAVAVVVTVKVKKKK